MDIPQRLALCCACTVSLFFAGCAAHYPYQPYPYQQYPGGYYGQPNYMGPSMGAPPNGTQLNAPTPIESGTTNGGSSSGGGNAPMWDPDSTNNFNELENGGGSSGSNNSVPLYDEPSPGDIGPAPDSSTKKPDMFDNKSTFDSNAPPFGLNDPSTAESTGVRNVAFEENANTASAQPGVTLASNESFAEAPQVPTLETVEAPSPAGFASADFKQPVERTNPPQELSLPYDPKEIPNPFEHDPEGYRFLRGLVSYDDQLQAWSIIYDDKPSRDDPYGGVFTLADAPGLTVLNDNDVVYIEGHISDTLKDEFDKPRYIVEHLTPLRRKAQP